MKLRLRWPAPRRVSVWLIVAIGCTVSVLAWKLVREQEEARTQASFFNRAHAQASLARERLRLYQEMIFSLRDSFLGQELVTRAEFNRVSAELLRRHSGVMALEWVYLAPREQRTDIENQATRELGFPFQFKQRDSSGQLRPAGEAPEYAVILYAEPVAGNERILGYDINTAPTAEFVAAARRDRKLIMSRAFRLGQSRGPDDEPGIVFILPVFASMEADSPVIGFVQSVFQVQTMLSQAHQIGDNEGLRTFYLDREPGSNKTTLLYANFGGHEPMRKGGIRAMPLLGSPRNFEDIIEVGGRRLVFLAQRDPVWARAQQTNQPHFLLAAGLAITGLLALFVNSLLSRTDRIAREVELRTHELRDSEARLQAILDHNPNAIFVKNLEGRYVLINRQYERDWQTSTGSVLGRTDDELFSPEIAASYRRTDEQVRTTGESLRFELTVDHPGGIGPRTGLVQKFPLRDASGQIYGICGISTDISDRKLAEQEKLAIERKLLEAQKLESLGVLAGGIAHDFNNILTSVLANASYANRILGPGNPAAHSLEQIELAARRSADLCQQMLAYAGKGKISSDPVDLSELVRGTAALLEVTLSKNTRLDLRLTDGLPAVQADATQLRQIVMNLVINAADAISGTAGVITVETFARHADAALLRSALGHPELPPGRYVGLAVTDNGCGMSPATLARIFEPFFTTKFSGRGLGLSAVLGIIQSHQGALFVESTVGRGSTFRLLLPASKAPVKSTAPQTAAARRLTLRGTVLVVDDEPAVRLVAGEVLRLHGASTVLAASGEAALALLPEYREKINLVLLDMTMPGLGGDGTLQQLRAAGLTCPVILMSGYSETEAMRRTANLGVSGFIQKPFEIDTLVDRLKPYLG